jgi:hypothetical protein
VNHDQRARDTLISKARLLGADVSLDKAGYLQLVAPRGMRWVYNHGGTLWAWGGHFCAALELFEQGIEEDFDW